MKTAAIPAAPIDWGIHPILAIVYGATDPAGAWRLDGTGPAAQPALADSIGRFVDHKRRHVALENALFLPIPRLRLTGGDQAAMSRSMTARRAG